MRMYYIRQTSLFLFGGRSGFKVSSPRIIPGLFLWFSGIFPNKDETGTGMSLLKDTPRTAGVVSEIFDTVHGTIGHV